MFKSKKLSELETGKKCRANNFLFIDTQYRKNMSVILDNELKIVLLDM